MNSISDILPGIDLFLVPNPGGILPFGPDGTISKLIGLTKKWDALTLAG